MKILRNEKGIALAMIMILAAISLGIIAGLKSKIEEVRKSYTSPIRQHLDSVNQAFKDFTAPLTEADSINRKKMKEFKDIEAQKMAIAEKEMETKGEVTVELQEPAPERVHTATSTVGTRKVWKWELEDFSIVPDEYKVLNESLLTSFARSTKGTKKIPGIKIYEDSTVMVNKRKVNNHG